jgi:hypothetical protein
LLGVSLTGVFFALALSLPTIWRQYLAPPVPFLLCGFAYPLASLRELSSRRASRIPIGVAVVLLGIGVLAGWATGLSTSEKIAACFEPERWVPMKVHKTAADIAESTKEPKLILTLGPLFALEGGCEIYPELSAGPFAYRIGNLMTETDRQTTHTAGPEQIAQLAEGSPPSAIIAGVEPQYFSSLEDPLESLGGADWSKKSYENGLRVYFRP